MQGPDAYEIIGNKIKVKYNSLQWNQHEKDLDIFEDINRVDAYCGDDVICWLDTFNWSVMNKTKLTEDVYQFISHRAGLVRRSIDNEVELAKVNGVNWEVLEPVQYAIKKGAMNIIDFIF